MEVSVRALVRYLVTGEGGGRGRVSVRSGVMASAISLGMFFVLLSDGTGYDTSISSPAQQSPSRLSKRPTRMSTLLIGSVSVPFGPLPLPPHLQLSCHSVVSSSRPVLSMSCATVAYERQPKIRRFGFIIPILAYSARPTADRFRDRLEQLCRHPPSVQHRS